MFDVSYIALISDLVHIDVQWAYCKGFKELGCDRGNACSDR